MTRITLFCVATLLFLSACERVEEQPITEEPVHYISFGEEIPEDRPALTVADLDADPLSYHGQDVRVEGRILEICQQRGCWVALENPTGDPVRVHVPRDEVNEYAWVLPMDLGPLPAIIEGLARADTLSVEQLQHYAEDAGRSEAEIQAITEPEMAVHIVARGILVEEPASPAAPPDVDTDVDTGSDVPLKGDPSADNIPVDDPVSSADGT